MVVDYMDLLDIGLLFAGDNVDHNILTLDGMGTLHGMGIITALTSRRKGAVWSQWKPSQSRFCNERQNFNHWTSIGKLFVSPQPGSRSIGHLGIVGALTELHIPNTWMAGNDARHPTRTRSPRSIFSCILPNDWLVFWGQDIHFVNPGLHLWPCRQTPCSANYYIRSATLLESCRDHHWCTRREPPKNIVLMLGYGHTFMNLIGATGTFILTDGTDSRTLVKLFMVRMLSIIWWRENQCKKPSMDICWGGQMSQSQRCTRSTWG